MSALRTTPRRKIVEKNIAQVDALVSEDKKPNRVTSIRFPDRLMLKMKLVADYKNIPYSDFIRDVLEREVDRSLQERFSKPLTAVH